MAALDETRVARQALDVVWRHLAAFIDEAKRVQSEASRDPEMLNDPRFQALDRWLFLFDRELAAVQTVHDAAEAGSPLSPEELRIARHTGARLLDVVSRPPVVGRSADESLTHDEASSSGATARTAHDQSLTRDETNSGGAVGRAAHDESHTRDEATRGPAEPWPPRDSE